jgi:rod shape-determining protein MreC
MQVQLLADQAMHAADVSADRLPSLHDDGAPAGTPEPMIKDGADAPPPPDNSTGLVPRPKPVLHPDRYSQGSTPPASELTPGAARPAQTANPQTNSPQNSEAPHL